MRRMQLKFHREQRDLRRYVLAVDKDGPKLTPHEAQTAHDPWIDITPEKFLHLKLTATAVPMDYVAFRLAQLMDRPVVDMTGLKGGYDFQLVLHCRSAAGISRRRKGQRRRPGHIGPDHLSGGEGPIGAGVESRPRTGGSDRDR